MANKRDLKKALNFMVEEIIHDCFVSQSYDSATETASNEIITEAITLNNNALSKISAAQNKVEMKAVVAEIETASTQLFEKLEKL